ncbi:hypothetical protein BDK51DRAFT_27966 [Blyttiomyces helicus]|uniref:Uncharacterized protein n=1 Tax=Blyttiomyces helicus TaxID=388810 RepID=A0A4P9WCR2_9FUNG|nr:hypothetical protein BDK51DRAFT_27966 [Blyttiomyces helicus]|eukprot:RKO90304.1 hypothetical protein BDK51DRAFT_27966 [Blyttiomyces helicus]
MATRPARDTPNGGGLAYSLLDQLHCRFLGFDFNAQISNPWYKAGLVPHPLTDKDGNQYGWEKGRSCIFDLNPGLDQSHPVTVAPAGTTVEGHPTCNGYISNPWYKNSLVWGRENGRDCIPFNDNYPEGNEPWNIEEFKNGFHICHFPVPHPSVPYPSVDKNGNDYGWEKGRSCIVYHSV